jgi:hypothetical protein
VSTGFPSHPAFHLQGNMGLVSSGTVIDPQCRVATPFPEDCVKYMRRLTQVPPKINSIRILVTL